MKINFTGMKSLPMYGKSVEELYLDIDGEHYVVKQADSQFYAGVTAPRLLHIPTPKVAEQEWPS